MNSPQSRRSFLYGMGATLGGVAFTSMLADEAHSASADGDHASGKSRGGHFPAKAKSCIFLLMEGGPSHIDTFDPKPKLKQLHLKEFHRQGDQKSAMESGKRYYVESPFRFRKAGQCGADMAVDWAHLADVADDICFYRGCQVESVNHPTALYQLNTGNRFGGDPAIGSWVTYGLGSENKDLPGFVVLPELAHPQGGAANWSNGFLPAQFQGTPLRPTGSPILNLQPPQGMTLLHQRKNLDLLAQLNQAHLQRFPWQDELAARMQNYELAFRMQMQVPGILEVELIAAVFTGYTSPADNDDPLAAPPGRMTVSILWFENRAGADAEHWKYGLNGFLNKALKQVHAIRVRNDGVGYARRELSIEKSSALKAEQARKIGEIVEAQRVVWGSYQGSGNSWQVTAFVLNVANGEISHPITVSGTDWFDLRDALARQILEQLRIVPSEEEKEKMLRRETHSLQALEWRVKSYAHQAEGKPLTLQEEATRRAIAADTQYAEVYLDLGAELASQGKFDEAQICLRRALEIKPDLASAHHILGMIHLFRKQDTEALKELQEALRLDSENVGTLVRLSEFYGEKKQWEQAMAYAEEAIALAPLDSSLHAHLGLIYVYRHKREQAMRELKEAERLADPDASGDLDTVQKIGQSCRLLGEIPLAVKHYERLVAQARATGANPEIVEQFDKTLQYMKTTLTPTFVTSRMPRTFTEQALQKALQEELSPAELDMVVNPIAGNPGISRWARQLTAGATNEIDKAKAIFDELIQRIQLGGGRGKRTAREVFAAWGDPDQVFSCQEFAKLYLALARDVGIQAFYVHLGRDYRGKLVFHDCTIVFVGGKALLVDPAYRWFGVPHQEFTVLDDVQTVAHQLFQHGSGERSVERCRAAAKLHPDFAWGQVCLASALVDDDQLNEAIKVLENAERLEPGRWDAHRLRGFMAVKNEDWNAALTHANKALELNPEDAMTLCLQGMALQAQGKEEGAREAYRACLRHRPKDDMADHARRAIVEINERIGADSGEEFNTAALMVAIAEGRIETVRAMLAEGIDADTQEPSGATALMMAAHHGHSNIVILLLDHRADVDLKDHVRDYTALMVAAQEGHLDIVHLLLSAGADVNIARKTGETAMHAAADPGHVQVIKLLLKKGADVNASSSMGVTPLFLASQQGHTATVKELLDAGADVDAVEKTAGATALFIASQNGHADVVKLLLANKADVNGALKYNGYTPLIIAVVRNHADVVKLLLNAGADMNTKGTSQEGQQTTPLETARKLGHEKIVELLQSAQREREKTEHSMPGKRNAYLRSKQKTMNDTLFSRMEG